MPALGSEISHTSVDFQPPRKNGETWCLGPRLRRQHQVEHGPSGLPQTPPLPIALLSPEFGPPAPASPLWLGVLQWCSVPTWPSPWHPRSHGSTAQTSSKEGPWCNYIWIWGGQEQTWKYSLMRRKKFISLTAGTRIPLRERSVLCEEFGGRCWGWKWESSLQVSDVSTWSCFHETGKNLFCF